MADEPKPTGLPPGVAPENLDDGQGLKGAPKAPEVTNTPPPIVPDKAAEEAAAKKKAEDEAAQKLKDEADKKPKEEETPAPKALEYPVYNDEAADAAVTLLKDAGVTPAEADAFFKEAVETGDINKIDIAGLTAKVGKEKANLILLGAKDFYNRNLASVQESVKAVHDIMGGEDNWNTVVTWARKQAQGSKEFDGQMQEFNKMFNLSKSAATLAARELRTLYEKGSGNKSLGNSIVHGDHTGAGGQLGSEPLSRLEYIEKRKEAERTGNHDEAARLDAQRMATVQRNK